ncbi:penicillin-binding protein 1C [Candidatus Peribacteria bacterium RIFCSPLOWO2_12_FULL_53_10]|nr:MAG: penicillin-binding protein 1C [Candidatus Peribacteria bacterium RIFCSPLOWO2_12_FULL_53_10]
MPSRNYLHRLLLATILTLLLLAFALPLPKAIQNPPSRSPVSVLDRNGTLLYEARQNNYGSQKHLTFAEIPPAVIDALIAVEDRSFRTHHGISVRGIARAMTQNLQEGRIISGGSTLTQQLVRIRLNPKHRTVLYKLREMLLAVKLDARLSKDEILEQYLSSVYFGHQAYGLRSASHTYFGKDPHELSSGEIALLIGIIQSPVVLDPFENMEGALARRQIVLDAMKTTGVIYAEDVEQSAEESVRLTPDRTEIEAPHFSFWVLQQHADRTDPGAQLRTTLDLDLQHAVEDTVARKLLELKDKNATSASVVILDAHNGDILTMIGSNNYFDSEHDGAVNVAISARQPGSSLKPFTYALALSRGATAATTVADTEVQLLTEEGNPYTPRNYDYELHGLTRYREALANSYNIAAVKVLEKLGVQPLLEFLRAAGITTLTKEPEFYGLALTLGSGEVRLLELAEAYGIFPRGGKTLHARALLDEPVETGKEILEPRIAWIISDILSDASARLPEFGEDTPLSVSPHQVAAKTGTTRNARDNWVLGYTPDRIVGVWVGNANNSPMKGTSGVTGAGPIFHDVMEIALEYIDPKPFFKPSGITKRTICSLSGKLPTPTCPHTMEEYFVEGTEPKKLDDMHRLISLDRRNGLLAGEGCPEKFVIEQSFTVFPPEVRPWARENGYHEPPSQYSPLCTHSEFGTPHSEFPEDSLTITKPHSGDSFLLDPLIPDEHEKIILEARADSDISSAEWFVDGKSVGKAQAPDFRMEWQPVMGMHAVKIIAEELQNSLQISVTEP